MENFALYVVVCATLPPMAWSLFRPKGSKDVLDRLESLERRFSGLQMEWDDVYDKLRRTMSRIVKSHARLSVEDEREPVEAPGPAPVPNQGPHGGMLSPRQKEIQQQILKRRAGG